MFLALSPFLKSHKTFVLAGALLVVCATPAQAMIFPQVTLEQFANAGNRPVAIRTANDGSGRLFIVRQPGDILIYDGASDSILPTPFLNIINLVNDSGSEQGLLGLAFHPNYVVNGFFYVYYTAGAGAGRSVIARYKVSGSNPNAADPSSATVLMEFVQDESNHNAGDLHFGPDGYLYIASGDGGGSGDPLNRAQNLNSLLGKILRIDVNGTTPAGPNELCGVNPSNYGIPAGNPFAGNGNGCDEIWSYGWRNPWRFSFDRVTGNMFVGDVGQNDLEEISFQSNGAGGLNYGWRCREGDQPFNNSPPCVGTLTEPILTYDHSNTGCGGSITGGYLYRGSYVPLRGYYIYADFCSGDIWFASQSGSQWTPTVWMDTNLGITTFGENEDGEILLADIGGGLYRIKVPTVTPPPVTPSIIDFVPIYNLLLGGKGK